MVLVIRGNIVHGWQLNADGTAQNPAIQFQTADQSGLYHAGNGNVGVSVNGTQQLVISGSGMAGNVVGNVVGNLVGNVVGNLTAVTANIGLTRFHANGITIQSGNAAAPSLVFTGNVSRGMYFDTTANLVTINTPLQTDTGIVMAMNTSVASGGHSVLIHPMACAVYTASAPGVATGLGAIGFPPSSTGDQYTNYQKQTPALYDFWRTYVNLVAGTYTFRIHHAKANDRGIVSIVLNGSTVGTIDSYNGSIIDVVTEITGIVLGSSGTFKLEMQINSKNASSSAYYFLWKSASFVRTA